jgi:hypothetical protein
MQFFTIFLLISHFHKQILYFTALNETTSDKISFGLKPKTQVGAKILLISNVNEYCSFLFHKNRQILNQCLKTIVNKSRLRKMWKQNRSKPKIRYRSKFQAWFDVSEQLKIDQG